jgi:hypothetical protein
MQVAAVQSIYKNGQLIQSKQLSLRLFWFMCGNEAYTDSFFGKIVVKVLLSQHFTIP